MLAISYITAHFLFASAKYLFTQNCKAPSGVEIFDGFSQSELKQDADLARRDLAKDAKIARRRAYAFDSLRLCADRSALSLIFMSGFFVRASFKNSRAHASKKILYIALAATVCLHGNRAFALLCRGLAWAAHFRPPRAHAARFGSRPTRRGELCSPAHWRHPTRRGELCSPAPAGLAPLTPLLWARALQQPRQEPRPQEQHRQQPAASGTPQWRGA